MLPRATDPWLLGWHFEKEVQWPKMDLRWWFAPPLAPELATGAANASAFLAAHYRHSPGALSAAWNCSRPLTSFAPTALSACLNPPHFVADCSDAMVEGPPGLNMSAVTRDSRDFLVQHFARRYFDVVTRAIRRYDLNHLLLGMRGGVYSLHTGYGASELLALFASYVDVYDLHSYADVDDGGELLAQYADVHNKSGLPILHGEFAYTALDSNVPNLKGARSCSTDAGQARCKPGRPYVLQRERAAAAEAQARKIAAVPYVVGYHWWRWVDEAAGGRWPRAENSNYGLVRLSNEAYPELTHAFTSVNAEAAAIHKSSAY